MKKILLICSLFASFFILQGARCTKGQFCDAQFRPDTVLLNLHIENASTEYKLYDTIWIDSEVSDEFYPLSGEPASFVKTIDELWLSVQPYKIVSDPTSYPSLQYANIEFNPVPKEGALQNINGSGYLFKFHRLDSVNRLSAGIVAGQPGMYLIQCVHSRFPTSSAPGRFEIFSKNDCVTYWGKSTFPSDQQNLPYWDSLQTSQLSQRQHYGSQLINARNSDYVIVKVVP